MPMGRFSRGYVNSTRGKYSRKYGISFSHGVVLTFDCFIQVSYTLYFLKFHHISKFRCLRNVACFSQASGPKLIQALQIQEVHPGAYSNTCNFWRFICFSYLTYLGHASLLGQRPEDRATLVLSSRLSPITWRHP